MSRIYIDLTTSVRWRRPPVGIVRVEREFARHCLEHEPSTVFCNIDAAGIYRAMSTESVRVVLDDAWCRDEPTVAVSAEPVPPAPPPLRRTRIQRTFDWAAAWGPKVVPAAAYPLLRDLGRVLVDHHGAWLRHRESKRAMRAPAPVSVAPPEPAVAAVPDDAAIEPTRNDVFVSIGLQWHHGAIHAWKLKQRSGVRVVEACYDTIPIDYPEYAGSAKQPFAEHFVCIAHAADLVFAISNTSSIDLARFYERVGVLERPPIRTVYLATPDVHADAAVDALADDERNVLTRLARDGEYVLYVSSFEVRKNHRLLLQIWKDLYRERGETCPLLVVVGMFGWGVNDLWAEMQASEVWAAGKIVLLHHVSDALLAHLYRGCAFTVFPSVYEGWGLAATESLAYGKLAIVSDAPALQEATQGLCPVLHPFDFPGWRETIARYVDDGSLRAEAEARIRATYVPRHWRDFSVELLAAARGAP